MQGGCRYQTRQGGLYIRYLRIVVSFGHGFTQPFA